jgi:Tfp pilus assembly protein PilV
MIEVLITIGISAFFTLALLGYLLIVHTSTARSSDNAAALWNAQEGLDALRSISFSDLDTTLTGALAFTNNTWTLQTNGPQALDNGTVRTITVEDVYRDTDCLITSTGGTLDIDSKKLTSAVTWTDHAGRSHTQTFTTLRTRWDAPQGACFAAEQVTQVAFDISAAEFFGGKQLRQIFFTNTGTTDVTIDKIILTWDNATSISQLFVDNSKVWSSTGPGAPTYAASSGATLDIQNFSITAGDTVELNKGQFASSMTGVTVTITVIFTDASQWSSPSFMPL